MNKTDEDSRAQTSITRLDESLYPGYLAVINDDSGPKEILFTYYGQDSSYKNKVSSWMPRLGKKYTIKKPASNADHAVEILDRGGWQFPYSDAAAIAEFRPNPIDTAILENTVNLEHLATTIQNDNGDLEEEWFIDKWMLVKLSKTLLFQLFPNADFSNAIIDKKELICDVIKWKEVETGREFNSVLAWVVYLTEPRVDVE